MFSENIDNSWDRALPDLTVPQELFEKDANRIGMLVIEVYQSKSGNGYCFGEGGFVEAEYEYVDDNTVVLSKPKF